MLLTVTELSYKNFHHQESKSAKFLQSSFGDFSCFFSFSFWHTLRLGGKIIKTNPNTFVNFQYFLAFFLQFSALFALIRFRLL